MALMPGAIHKLIARHNSGPRMAAYNRVNGHVAVSEAASLFGLFSGSVNCSHFYVRKDGTIEQYMDTVFRSKADRDGNDATISIETQGGVVNPQGEPWTSAQVAAIARIYAWAVATHGIKMKLATSSQPGEASKGLSWHRLGVDGNFPALPDIRAGRRQRGGGMFYSKSAGKICPGDAKIRQIPEIFALASGMPVAPAAPAPAAPAAPAPAAPAPAAPAPRNYLLKGDTGPAVGALQRDLNRHGLSLVVDGVFGDATEAGVRRFQHNHGLVIDGIAGEATRAALAGPSTPPPAPANVLMPGSSGQAVKDLQWRLKTSYPAYAKRLVVDGLYGPATTAVVKEFQRRSGLVADGIAGPKTKAALGL